MGTFQRFSDRNSYSYSSSFFSFRSDLIYDYSYSYGFMVGVRMVLRNEHGQPASQTAHPPTHLPTHPPGVWRNPGWGVGHGRAEPPMAPRREGASPRVGFTLLEVSHTLGY